MPTLKIILDGPWGQGLEKDPTPPAGISFDGPKHVASGAWQKEAGGHPGITTFIIITVALPIAINLLSQWLYNLLSNHGRKRIRIQEEEITVEQGEIARILTKTLEIDE